MAGRVYLCLLPVGWSGCHDDVLCASLVGLEFVEWSLGSLYRSSSAPFMPSCVCMQCCMHWGAWLEPPRKLKQLVVATHERLLFRSSFGLPRTVLVTTDHQMNLHRVCRACLRLPPLSPRGNSWHLGRLAVRWLVALAAKVHASLLLLAASSDGRAAALKDQLIGRTHRHRGVLKLCPIPGWRYLW
jgi:hypothetical protein